MIDEPEEVWPVRNAAGETVAGDARTYLTQWVKDLAAKRDDFRVALDKLAGSGCDPLKVAWLLSALENAQGWRNISRSDLRDVIRDLKKAAKGVDRLFFSQLNQLIGLDSRALAGELTALAARAQEFEPDVNQRRPMGRDLVRAALVLYVKEASGQFHDDSVAPLIGVAEEPLSLRDSTDDDEPAGYTTEAHVQWRNRDSCQSFLDAPSDDVRTLIAEMTRELET